MRDTISSFSSCLMIGGAAGCLIEVALYPLDTIKTRIQSHQSISFSKIYKGISWTPLASIPSTAIFWGSYVLSQNYFDSSKLACANLLAASIASVSSNIVRNPFEVVKQQLQVGMHNNSLKAPLNIVHTQGLSGLYAGVVALVLRELPFDCIQMVTYEYLKSVTSNSLFWNMMNGGVAGGIAGFITTPIDYTKTRQMTKGHYSSFLSSVVSLRQEHGFRVFWRGCLLRVVYSWIGGVIFFGIVSL